MTWSEKIIQEVIFTILLAIAFTLFGMFVYPLNIDLMFGYLIGILIGKLMEFRDWKTENNT